MGGLEGRAEGLGATNNEIRYGPCGGSHAAQPRSQTGGGSRRVGGGGARAGFSIKKLH